MACLIIVSSLAHILSRSRLGLAKLVDQVGQDKDHISQGQGQELDNFSKIVKKSFIMLFINIELKTEL